MDTIANKNNNPGNLKDPSTGQFQQFGSPQEGYAALMNDLEIKKSGRSKTGLGPQSTLADFAKVYAPASDKNNPAQYAANLANHMRVRPDATLASLDTGKWADAVAHSEGYVGQQEPAQDQTGQSQPKVGFLQGLIRGVASPFLRAGANIATLGDLGNKEAFDKDMSQGVSYGDYLGSYRPIGATKDAQGNDVSLGRRFADTVGTGVEAAATVLPVGEAANVVEKGIAAEAPEVINAVSKGRVIRGAVQGAKSGAVLGGLAGTGQGLQDPNASVGSVVGQGLLGGAEGALTGGALGGTSGLAAKANKEVRQGAAVEDNMKNLTELENANKPLRNVVADASKNGVDVKDIVSKTDLLHNAVDTEGIVRTKQEGGALSQLTDFMSNKEGVIRANLEKEGATVNIKDVEKKINQSIEESGLKGGAKVRAQNEAKQDIEGYLQDADKDGNIPLTSIHDAKIDKYSNINYTNPESQKSGKAIASALKNIVETGTKSVDVQNVNKELQRYYHVRDFLENLDGKRVKGGRLGKYFAKTTGAIAGSHFGPLGSFVGSEVTGKIHGLMAASKFGGSTGNALEESPLMKEAIARGEGLIRKLPVKSLPSEYTNDLPTIEAGKTKFKKGGNLPNIKF